MKIIITGSNGQLGRELTKILKERNGFEVVSLDRESLNITNLNYVTKAISYSQPNVVINCAAHTAVDLCESDEENAYKINALGPRNLAIACEKIGAKLVHISTDYVFDGKNKTPYREYETTCPNTVYGESKLLGEKLVREFSSKHFIIRTAWLYGDGKNFVTTMLNLAKNQEEIRVVNDQIGSPTSTVDLARVIVRLIYTEYYGTYHGTCEGQCSWYDFAKKIFELKNVDVKVIPVSSNEFKRPAPRPSYSVLDNFMLRLIDLNSFRYWEESLKEYLNSIN